MEQTETVTTEMVQRGHALKLAQSLSEQSPFADNTFDMALLHEVIEHVQDDRQTVAERGP